MKTLACLAAFAAFAGPFFGASSPEMKTEAGRDLIDTAMQVHRFDTFLMLVRDADLMFNLKGGGPYTIFAPTDDAFDKMPGGLLDHLHGNAPRLKQFLLHHVVRGNMTAEQVVRARRLTALDGRVLIARNLGGHGTVGGAGFTIGNIRTSNGTLHAMDAVIMSASD
ncbi:MAG: fasciclin domain-containing protein [Fimbriimonadaceae bacterium]|nr:fasciclin domain-containing protein [Fimbriimonadaceae bacterium]